jgi:hypothetical protein
MLALKGDRRRPGPFVLWEAMTQIPFQKLVMLAYNLHTGRAQTFAITGAASISISLSRYHKGHQDRDICTASTAGQKPQDVSLRSAGFR